MKKFRCSAGSWGGLIYNDEFTVVAKDIKEAEELCLKRIKEKLGKDFDWFEYDLYQGNGGIAVQEVAPLNSK